MQQTDVLGEVALQSQNTDTTGQGVLPAALGQQFTVRKL